MIDYKEIIKKNLIRLISEVSGVKKVIDYSSSQYVNQRLEEDSDLDLLILVKENSSLEELREVLLYLMKSIPKIFEHKFLILPESLYLDFLQLQIYHNDKFGLNPIHDYNKFKSKKVFYNALEWSICKFFTARSFWEKGYKDRILHKSYLGCLRNICLLYNIQPTMKGKEDTFHLQVTKAKLLLVKKQIQDKSDEIILKFNLKNLKKFSFRLHRNFFGYILFCPNYLERLLTVLLFPFGKWSLRVMNISVFNYLSILVGDNSQDVNLHLSQKKNFYNKQYKFIKENGLSEVSVIPIPHSLIEDGWKTIFEFGR